jgi:NarL family two-component system response regulator LiaR
MSTIRVYGVDDHPVVRYGLAAMLAQECGISWVGAAADAAEALRAAPGCAPDVMLVSLELPRLDGIAAMRVLRPLLPKTRCVLMIGVHDPATVRRAIAGGAVGVLCKKAGKAELVNAIQAAHFGCRLLPPELADGPAAAPRGRTPGADLTPRERQLLALMARGLANHEIGARLAIGMPTVKFHVTNILSKLNAENRTGAVLAALRHQIVGLE